MSVGEICNRNVAITAKGSSVQEAAELMRRYHVGDLVVVEERDGRRVPVGILTDRDIVVEINAPGLALDTFTAEDIMSSELVTVREDQDMLETIKLMRSKGVRRVPVVDGDGALVGILAADDLIELMGESLTDLAALIARQQQREQKLRR